MLCPTWAFIGVAEQIVSKNGVVTLPVSLTEVKLEKHALIGLKMVLGQHFYCPSPVQRL
jgi:hypothetical protein